MNSSFRQVTALLFPKVIPPSTLWTHQAVKRLQHWNAAEEISVVVPDSFRSPFSLIEKDLQRIPNAIGEVCFICLF